MAKGGSGVSTKGVSTNKGAISTPFKDAVATPKGLTSPAPVQKK